MILHHFTDLEINARSAGVPTHIGSHQYSGRILTGCASLPNPSRAARNNTSEYLWTYGLKGAVSWEIDGRYHDFLAKIH